MWQSLKNYADAELEASSEAVKLSFSKLHAAAQELQQGVKELLADYREGDAGERGSLETNRSSGGGEGEDLGHVARLLAHLWAQPPRAEEETTPGTIFTPRGPQTGAIVPNETGLSVVPGDNTLKALLLADVPALRWDQTAGPPGAAGPGPPLPLPGPRGGASQRLAAKPSVCVDVASLDAALAALQGYCREVQAEAVAGLREMHTADATPALAYRHLLQQAAVGARLSGPQRLSWSWVPFPCDGGQVRTRQLMVAVVHSSRSATDAWAALTEAFSHDMALPDAEAARLMGPRCRPGPSGGANLGMTPDSYLGLLAELHRTGEQWLAERLEKRDVQPECSGADNCTAEDLALVKSGLEPQTYLQVVGQKLLYHASQQVPCMAQLPERIPDWVLRTLYGRPFAEAVKLALQAALADPAAPGSGCAVCSSEKQAAGAGKALHSPMPREQQAVSHSGRSASFDPAGGAAAAGAVGGGTAAGEAEGPALQETRARVVSLSAVCRDVLAFEEGFAAVLGRLAPGETDQVQPAATPTPLHSLPYATALAYLSVIREEVARAMRAAQPALQATLCGVVTAEVQACLSASDSRQPPRPLRVTPDVWPAAAAGTAPGTGGGGSGGDGNAPRLLDPASCSILSFASWLHSRLESAPEPLQVVLYGTLLECLCALMDHLSSSCTALREMPGEPLPRLFLAHSAACCVRRRLESCPPLGAVSRGPAPTQPDEAYLLQVQQHGECLVQADELVSNIHQHILMAHQDVVQSVVLASLDRTDWCAFRPEVMRGASAGPGVRLWHCLMLRLTQTAVQHSSPHVASWIVGQVLQDGLVCQAQRYQELCPTVQLLREFVADAVHIVATVFLLCQPLTVGRPTLESQLDVCLRVPYPLVAALAATARELLTRAALLHVPGSTLVDLARGFGLWPPNDDATKPTPPQPPLPREGTPPPLQPSSSVPWSSGASHPAGQSGAGGGGGIRLSPLPAIHAPRTPLSTERWPPEPVGEGVATAGSAGRDPACLQRTWQPIATTGTGGNGGAPHRAAAAAAEPATTEGNDDDQRLTLWSSWLSDDVLQALRREVEGLDLSGTAGATVLMPLGDRMEELAGAEGGSAPRQSSPEDGRVWRRCLEHVAGRDARRQQVLLALARRHELHPAVGTEPAGNAESRRAVRGLARQLGLLPEQGAGGREED